VRALEGTVVELGLDPEQVRPILGRRLRGSGAHNGGRQFLPRLRARSHGGGALYGCGSADSPNNARASFRQTRPASTVSVLLVSASIHWPGSSERSTATTASATADIGGATSVTTKVLVRTLAARQLVDE
jgi:hypothetical protein